jgi:hypothetical protein
MNIEMQRPVLVHTYVNNDDSDDGGGGDIDYK